MMTKALDFNYLLIENYKKLNLSEEEVSTILMIDHLINQGNKLITADLLSLKMTLSIEQIDNILTLLLKRGLIEYATKRGHTVTSLDPINKLLEKEFAISLEIEKQSELSNEIKEAYENCKIALSEAFARELSPIEKTKIKEWISSGYTSEIIINCLKESISENKKTLEAVQNKLLAWSARQDIETEGNTTLSKNWNKNLEETIRIAKTPWLDDDK